MHIEVDGEYEEGGEAVLPPAATGNKTGPKTGVFQPSPLSQLRVYEKGTRERVSDVSPPDIGFLATERVEHSSTTIY